jgi:SprT protein
LDFEFIPLDDETLARELGEISDLLKQRVNAKVDEVLKMYPDVKSPTIKYDLKGHTAGWAIGGHTIRLNAEILNNPKHTDDMINRTVPHEVAHIVVQQKWPNAKGHGREWRGVMYRLGLNAERCHQYETKAARKRPRPYEYYCNCDTPHRVTITLHRRIQSGRPYRCRRCKAYLRERK